MARSTSDRSAQITVKVDPNILAGLRDIAARIGMAPTTVAAMAIGEYVAKTQAGLNAQASIADTMAKEMARVIGGPLASHFEGKSPEELKALFADDESPEKQHDWTADD
jgi:predicted transcriptional regulator